MILSVLPVKSLFKKIAIIWMVRNNTISMNLSNSSDKKEFNAYMKIKFTKKAFGKKFIDNLGPTYFNSMSFD